MKTIEQLINNLSGQLNGIKRMIELDKDCVSVVTQMKAVKSGLNSVMDKYTMENIGKCMDKGLRKGKIDEMKKMISELTKNN